MSKKAYRYSEGRCRRSQHCQCSRTHLCTCQLLRRRASRRPSSTYPKDQRYPVCRHSGRRRRLHDRKSAWQTNKSVMYHVPEQVTPGSVLAVKLALSTVKPGLSGVQTLLAPAPKVTLRDWTPGCVDGSGHPLALCFWSATVLSIIPSPSPGPSLPTYKKVDQDIGRYTVGTSSLGLRNRRSRGDGGGGHGHDNVAEHHIER
jgi:hypothetical protein